MGDIVSDGTKFSCPYCSSQLKISVLSSSSTGDSKKLASTGNFLFPPPPGAQCLLIPNAPVPCAPPSVSVLSPGQSAVEIDGKKALGAGCKLQCAKSGLLSVASSGQSVAQHDGASSGQVIATITAAISSTPQSEEKKKSSKEKNLENKKRDGAPKNNQAQNKQFKGAVKDIERKLKKKLSNDDLEVLHDEITGKNLSYHEIVDVGLELF